MLIVVAIAAGAACFGCVWLAWQVNQLRHRFVSALGEAGGQSVEQLLADNLAAITNVNAKLEQLGRGYLELADMTGMAAQKIAITRFNPFGDTGGEQSFALAVLDAHDSGYVLTSIHGREGGRVYAKPIDYGDCKYNLSAEESKALKLAMKRVPKPKGDN